jgi:transposase InsO family protein
MCYNFGIKCRHTTSYNPQGNSIIERVNQVMGNMLRDFELEETYLDKNNPWGNFLQACAYGIRSTSGAYAPLAPPFFDDKSALKAAFTCRQHSSFDVFFISQS